MPQETQGVRVGEVALSDASELDVVASFPRYDRVKLKCGIAHMSVGGFHRSHQALYIDRYLQTHSQDWMIYGIGNLDSDIALVNILNAQDNLYSLTERSRTTDTLRVIGSIKEFVHAPTNQAKVIDVLASDDIKIISLTITEKGYCYDIEKNLDLDHPMIKADIAHPEEPVSAIGFVYAAARRRMKSGGQPFTLMSCDNLPGNGRIASRIITQFAQACDPEVAQWIQTNVSFPNGMVDRITPAPSDETTRFVRDTFGIEDHGALASEDFLQWIIEDNFINGRPALEEVGVQFVNDVEPYEKCKVRLLNGSHSALSYLSYLMGYREVDAAMNDSLINEFVRRYMDEDITPCIPEVPGVDVEAYKKILVERFSNPAISDKIQRLAMDGSEKIPNALVPPIEYQLSRRESTKFLAFAVAAWYRYLRGVDEQGNTIDITDPMSQDLIMQATAHPMDPEGFIGIKEIFGESLSTNPVFIEEVTSALEAIESMGTKDALTKLLQK